MKMIVVAFALVAIAVAAPPLAEVAQTLHSEFFQDPEGSYKYGFETDHGMIRSETGELKEALDEDNKLHHVVVVRGSYTYIDNEGKQETINYFADETGFHPEGESIPKVSVSRR